jgi:hypothetical protein
MRFIAISCVTAATSLILYGCGGPAVPKGNYGSVFGTVKSSAGAPIANADVLIDFTIDVKTAADGTYKAPTVPADPGNNTPISVTATGFNCPSKNIPVTAGQQNEADFTCTPS